MKYFTILKIFLLSFIICQGNFNLPDDFPQINVVYNDSTNIKKLFFTTYKSDPLSAYNIILDNNGNIIYFKKSIGKVKE